MIGILLLMLFVLYLVGLLMSIPLLTYVIVNILKNNKEEF